MPCKHGTPYPNEVMWSGEPPSCVYCRHEEELKRCRRDTIREVADMLNNRQETYCEKLVRGMLE